jgi:uncharacterized metal-binding protein
MYTCAECSRLGCDTGDPGGYPANCPSLTPGRDAQRAAYRDGEDRETARAAALVEAHGYCRLTRVEEIMDFARRSGYRRLGVAFCIGLKREAAVFARVLRANGFSVDSVACKNGSLPKEDLGLGEDDKVSPGEYEPMCNPIGQAQALERTGTELNVLIGLCVGHDSLFMKHSAAPVTVLAAKDRVLGHNPLAALYLADGYYRERLLPSSPPDLMPPSPAGPDVTSQSPAAPTPGSPRPG